MESKAILTLGALSLLACIGASVQAAVAGIRLRRRPVHRKDLEHTFEALRAVRNEIVDAIICSAGRQFYRLIIWSLVVALSLGVACLSIPVIADQGRHEAYRHTAEVERAYPQRTAAIGIVCGGALAAIGGAFESAVAFGCVLKLAGVKHHESLAHISAYDHQTLYLLGQLERSQRAILREALALLMPGFGFALLLWAWLPMH